MTETTEKEREEREPKAVESALERKAEKEEGYDPEREKEGSSSSHWFLYLVLALIGYALSSGPVFFLRDRMFVHNSWIRALVTVFYAPVLWLYNKCPPIKEFLDWYVGLF